MFFQTADITRTQFETIHLPALNLSGQPIGQGKCKGVILLANFYQRDTVVAQPFANRTFYYGDRTRQDTQWQGFAYASIYVPCKDLSEVYVRAAAVGSPVSVQVMIYLSDDDKVQINNALR